MFCFNSKYIKIKVRPPSLLNLFTSKDNLQLIWNRNCTPCGGYRTIKSAPFIFGRGLLFKLRKLKEKKRRKTPKGLLQNRREKISVYFGVSYNVATSRNNMASLVGIVKSYNGNLFSFFFFSPCFVSFN